MKLLWLSCIASASLAQIGAPAKQVSPEVVKEMQAKAKAEKVTGLSAAELDEFKSLHAADARLLRDFLELMRQHRQLQTLVETLDFGVDPAKLADLKALQDAVERLEASNKAREERERRAEQHSLSRDAKLEKIWLLVIGTFASAVAAGVLSFLKYRFWDPDRREAAAAAVVKVDRERTADLIGHIEAAKCELVDRTELVRNEMRNLTGDSCAVGHVEAKITELAADVDFIRKRVNRLGGSGGMPIT